MKSPTFSLKLLVIQAYLDDCHPGYIIHKEDGCYATDFPFFKIDSVLSFNGAMLLSFPESNELFSVEEIIAQIEKTIRWFESDDSF